MAVRYVAGNKMTHHGQAAEAQQSWETSAMGEDPWKYRMAFLAMGGLRICPVKGCPGRAATSMAMRVHFLYRHVLDTVVFL